MNNFNKISPLIEELKINAEEHNPSSNDKKKKDKEITWVNVNNPGKKEIEYLRHKYGFDIKHLCVSSGKVLSHRPSLDEGENYIFMILHFPIIKEGYVSVAETDFFIGKNYLVTMHNNITNINNSFKKCRNEEDIFANEKIESPYCLLSKLLNNLISSAEPILDENAAKIDETEDLIFDEGQKKSVSEILNLKRNIINLRKIMQNHKYILEKLISTSKEPLFKYHDEYLDLIGKSKKIWQAVDSQNEMIKALHETNESMLNNRISEIMKTLTIFSVIVFPLNLFAAIFGMNTIKGMPFVESEIGFWVIIILMLLASLFMLLIFKLKRWI